VETVVVVDSIELVVELELVVGRLRWWYSQRTDYDYEDDDEDD
jgi:hypothetical protein